MRRELRIQVKLSEARDRIRDADQLLFRDGGIIPIAGRGDHSHAAKAGWWDEDLFCLEVRELKGGRAVTLESQVKLYPGLIDVYQTNPADRFTNYDRQKAIAFMRSLMGCEYGYEALAEAAMLHLPVLQLFEKPELNDQANDGSSPFCSEACAMADRLGGGVDPVPHLADRLTEPADLARSPFYEYQFTLVDG